MPSSDRWQAGVPVRFQALVSAFRLFWKQVRPEIGGTYLISAGLSGWGRKIHTPKNTFSSVFESRHEKSHHGLSSEEVSTVALNGYRRNPTTTATDCIRSNYCTDMYCRRNRSRHMG